MNDTSRRRAGASSSSPRADLFTAPNGLPKGFAIVRTSSRAAKRIGLRARLPISHSSRLTHGYLVNRQVVSFGCRYDYDRGAVVEASPFPSFLVSLRNKVAAIFDRRAEDFRQVLINEYRPGAGIGWHRDKAQFDEVVGVSLLAPYVLPFRRRAAETWDGVSLAVEPCSAYLLSGAARIVWEHSIPALDQLRYSITLRTLVAKAPSGEERM
jgi:alkylated DNA repair dioxygenase AlkB